MVTPAVTPMVSLWLTLSKLNFQEIDAPTHYGSFSPVVTPGVTPVVTPVVTPMVSLC